MQKDKMSSQFQQVTTAAQILELLGRLNPEQVKREQVFRAARLEPVVGLTVFPPNNCDPRIVAPRAPVQHLMQAAATAGARALPYYFCWADADNVAKSKRWRKRDVKTLGPYTSAVPNQHTCGSCWAVSSAGVFSDRWAIFTQGPNPVLSASNILSCVKKGYGGGRDNSRPTGNAPFVAFANCDGCNGGLPAGAAALFAYKGVVSERCEPYTWCTRNPACISVQGGVGGEGDVLNRTIPQCKEQPCAGPEARKYKARYYTTTEAPKLMALSPASTAEPGQFTERQFAPGTHSAALSITGVNDIQRELFANGPLVGAMAIFLDFQAGTMEGTGDGWAPTKGVYCNVQHGLFFERPYAKTAYGASESELRGYHAVAVVGWGIERNVKDWTAPAGSNQTFDLPYWIVRNSWGPQWNARCRVGPDNVSLPGHFKIAWTDRKRHINTMVLLDDVGAGELGGCTAFEPAVLRVTPPTTGDGDGDEEPVVDYGFMYDGTRCTPAPNAASSQYDSLDACVRAHPEGAAPKMFGCNAWKNKCEIGENGKYATLEECAAECGKQHSLMLGLVIGGAVLVATAIAVGVGVGVTRAKARRLV